MSSTQYTHRQALRWGLRSQPQETVTGAAQGVPWEQVVKVTRQKASAVPGSSAGGRFRFRSVLPSTDPGEERSSSKNGSSGSSFWEKGQRRA